VSSKLNNISEFISNQSKKHPTDISISMYKKNIFGFKKFSYYSFQVFDERVNKFVNKLTDLGVKSGDKILFFVKPNLDFSVITFALFRMGAIPVFIDPGMKKEYLFKAITDVSPDVLIGIPAVHVMRHFHKDVFSSIKIFITTGRFFSFFSKSIYSRLSKMPSDASIFKPKTNDLAAILYTSGGTGSPKGVEYTHSILIQQTKLLKEEFKLTSADIDIPGFPLFSFFTLALGLQSCIPDMNPAKPIECDPAKLYQNIIDSKATFLAGSPAIWERLADYCLQNKLKLETVRCVALFGAPVKLKIHQKFAQILKVGTTYTPYGATECLPVANISGDYILKNLSKKILLGKGMPVGKAVSGLDIKIISKSDDEIINLSDAQELSRNDIGEIIVRGDNMTKAYFQDSKATSASKIADNDKIWHRMGDVGFIDEDNLFWFCGRKQHIVTFKGKTYYPIQVELIYNQHNRVKRSALIKDPKTGEPAVVIERYDNKAQIDSMFLMDLKNLSQTHDHLKEICKFYAIDSFPVDTRHNIKIDRLLLAKLIEQRL